MQPVSITTYLKMEAEGLEKATGKGVPNQLGSEEDSHVSRSSCRLVRETEEIRRR